MSKREKKIPVKTAAGLLIFTLIIVVMAFTPLGFLKTGNLETSFLVVPVAIGSVVLGPVCGAVLGLVMGIVSFAQCFGASDLGSALLNASGINTFLLCIIPRVICGWMAGVFYDLLSRINKRGFAPQIAAAVVCPLANFMLFMLGLSVFFGQAPYIINLQNAMGAKGFFAFSFALGGMNLLYELLASLVVTTVVSTVIIRLKDRNSFDEEKEDKKKKAEK